jgi:hypothetical protein
VFQPIGGLIENLQKTNMQLDEMRFKQLAMSQTLTTWAQTVGQYEQFVMAMSKGSVNLMHCFVQE